MVRGIYIHIPFCHQICNYCDFNKVFFKKQPVDDYIEAIGKEMKMYVMTMPETFQKIETIYIGGGTPTALSVHQLERLMDLIHQYLPINQVIEFSTEANPDELTKEKLTILKQWGVNRLSIGVQSFNETLLQTLGRTHSNEHVFQTIRDAKDVGFQNISIDLMYGLPEQTIEDWEDTLQQALQLQLPHYSAYSLIVEPKTKFYIQNTKGRLHLPTEELEAEMYEKLMDVMEDKGLHQYEISNFAQQGYASIHNQIYWDNDEYFGLGAGAHGYIKGNRYSNIRPIKKYIDAVNSNQRPVFQQHELTTDEKCEEYMFLGLRKNEGVSFKEFERRYGISIKDKYPNRVQQLVKKQLLIEDERGIRLSQRGRFVGNEVFQQFLLM